MLANRPSPNSDEPEENNAIATAGETLQNQLNFKAWLTLTILNYHYCDLE